MLVISCDGGKTKSTPSPTDSDWTVRLDWSLTIMLLLKEVVRGLYIQVRIRLGCNLISRFSRKTRRTRKLSKILYYMLDTTVVVLNHNIYSWIAKLNKSNHHLLLVSLLWQ